MTNEHKLISMAGHTVYDGNNINCEPDCKYLIASDNDGYCGFCAKYGEELYWYDYFIAVCKNNGGNNE